MSFTTELRQLISQLFDAATDKETIAKSAVVSSKIDEIEAEQKASKENYDALLKDYKDVVLHTSFKPLNASDKGADGPTANLDPNQAFEEALKQAMNQKQ